jgi:hypothetical protein
VNDSLSEKTRDLPWFLLPLVVIFSPLIILIAIVVFALYFVTSVCLHILIWTLWCVRGRDILFVYSDSPVWHDYIEQRLLPPIRQRAIVLNWSQRKRWRVSLARAAFRHFGGYREFNPLAVVFRPLQPTKKFRFWKPFRDFKHGRPSTLHQMEREFFQFLHLPYDEPAA